MPNFFYVNFFWLFPLCYYFCGWALSLDDHEDFTKTAVFVASGDSPVSHAFVQTGSELHYFRDNSHQDVYIAAFRDKAASEKLEQRKLPKNVNLFEDEITDFGPSSIGVPVRRNVFVFNPTNSNILFSAISCSSIHFHVTVLEDRILEPKKRASFAAFFLPADNFALPKSFYGIIHVYTSAGIFPHKVRGTAANNPYRLSPHVDIKFPLNTTYSVPISIHNPHEKIIKVVEIFTNDPNIQLERDRRKWEIKPFETQKLSVATLLGNIERETAAFIILKIEFETENLSSYNLAPFHKKVLFTDKPPPNISQVTEKNANSLFQDLILPFRVQVVNKRSIFSTVGVLDFGLIKWGSEVKPQLFSIYSNLEKSVDFESIYVANSINKAHGIYMQFESKPPISVKGSLRNQPNAPVVIASVRLDSSPVDDEFTDIEKGKTSQFSMLREMSGTIVAESRGGNFNISIPYRAMIYRGDLHHNLEETSFHVGVKVPTRRSISLTNRLPFGIAIWNVSLINKAGDEIHDDSFHVELVSLSIQIPIGQTRPTILINYFKPKPPGFSIFCRLSTNITRNFEIPIHIFDGKLSFKIYTLDPNRLDFGALHASERRSIRLKVRNLNPTTIRLVSLEPPKLRDGVHHYLELIGQQLFEDGSKMISLSDEEEFHAGEFKSNEINITRQELWPRMHRDFDRIRWKPGRDVLLPSNSISVFNYSLYVTNLNSEHGYTDNSVSLKFVTQYGETYSFPVHFEVMPAGSGSVYPIPKHIVFNNVFPGSIRSASVKIYNSFLFDQKLLRMSVCSGDSRFYLAPLNKSGSTLISAGSTSELARLAFIPNAIGCPLSENYRLKRRAVKSSTENDSDENFCYTGIPLTTADGQWFAYGMKLPQNLAEVDSYLYFRLRRHWHLLMETGRHTLNATLLLDTEKVRQLEVSLEARFTWPRLLDRSVVHFPLTAVGNFTIVNLTLSNPSTQPVIIQLLPLVIYPDAEALIELFRSEFPAPLTGPIEVNETLMFSLRDTELFTLRPGSPIPQLREEVERVIGGPVPRFTLSMLLRPGMSTRIRIGFLPSDYTLRSSLLLIRNNLTALEPVVLYGRGARIGMQVENRTTRSHQQIIFDILPSHLTECSNPRRHLHRLPTTLTVRRTLAVWNSGEVPFHVINISISSGLHHIHSCENLGFRVLNCQPFRLDPGETTYLDVAYTPDFLMSVNDATLLLFMHMNATPWMFEMSARIPSNLLAICHAALPRPPFERVMYHSCTLALV